MISSHWDRGMCRRDFLRVTGAAAAGVTLLGLGVGCGGESDADAGLKDNSGDGTELTVLTWAGYDTPEFRGPWDTEHPDVKINWAFANEDAEFFAKMQQGFEADTLTAVWTKVYVDAGLVQPIDTTKLTNWSGVPQRFRDLGAFDGQQYFAMTSWGYSGILANTDKVSQPSSYAALWDPQYTGEISCFDSGEVVYAMSCMALGIDPSASTEDQEPQIAEKMNEFAKQCKSYWADSTTANTDFVNGNISILCGAWPLSYVEALKKKVPATYGGNDEGLMGWCGGSAVPSTTDNYDLALEFIDANLSVEGQSALANAWAQGICNYDAVPMIDEGVRDLMNLGDVDALDETIFLPPVDDRLRTLYTDLWADAKAQAAG